MNNKKTNQNHTSHLAPHTIINAKPVGALSVRNTKEDSQTAPIDHRGITLIALIITIIVMLILVGVTITVALNSGLFGTARKAAYQTEIAEIQEQLEIAKAVKVAENGGEEPSDYGITINDLPISDELKSKYGSKLVVSKNGTLYYDPAVVTDEEERGWLEEIGIAPYTGEEDATLSLLEKYFLGVDGTGRDFMNDIMDINNFTFKSYDQIEEHPEENLEFIDMNYGDMKIEQDKCYGLYDFYIKYPKDEKNAPAYRVKAYVDMLSQGGAITESVEKIYTPQGKEGEDLGVLTENDEYNGWKIIYDDLDGTVEAVAPTVVGEELTLGYDDTTINWEDETVIAEVDMDKNGTLEDIEKSIYSYNNAIKIINDYAKEQVTNPDIPKENIRSVGSSRENPYSENTTPYISDNLANWNSKYSEAGKGEDNNYEQDLIRMSYHGVVQEKNTNSYWLASRIITEEINSVNFYIRCINSDRDLGGYLWNVNSNGRISTITISRGVRPVIKVSGIY